MGKLKSLAVSVAQWLEHRTVDPKVGGSSPLTHPTPFMLLPGHPEPQNYPPGENKIFVFGISCSCKQAVKGIIFVLVSDQSR